MEKMLTTVCRHLRNSFIHTVERGEFVIASEKINAKGTYLAGQYILITGSLLNDGIYKVIDDVITLKDATDETFTGAICGLSIPADFLNLVDEISQLQDSSAEFSSAYVSESFGGWSGSRATNQNGVVAGWQETFAIRLNPFRKMHKEVIL